ncbi:CBN-NCX-6 protein [Aphelenchoides avenae]|nr:CBN-NCX-6 protein [Aphelenchus avenae]
MYAPAIDAEELNSCEPFEDVTDNATYVCEYVVFYTDACEGSGYLLWTQFVLCQPSAFLRALMIVFAALFLAYLFVAMNAVADDFFSRCISAITEHLGLSQNVAGITFLAFGNGSPDIFSSIATVVSVKVPKAGLAIGDLLGGGLFLNTIVVALITLVKPFQASRLAVVRDMCFYLVALGFTVFILLFDDVLYAWQPIGTVIMEKAVTTVKVTDVAETSLANPFDAMPSATQANLYDGAKSYMDEIREIIQYLAPWSKKDLEALPWKWKMWRLIRFPCTVALKLTVPLPEEPYRKLLAILHAFMAPLIISSAFQLNSAVLIPGGPQLYVYVICISTVCSVLVVLLTRIGKEPKYFQFVCTYYGFVISVSWIYGISSEVLNLVIMFGVSLRISHVVLGLTVMAWSNCVGDVVADTSIARQGMPRMAISAAVGGPLFNLLFGFGFSFLVAALQGKTVLLEVDQIKFVIIGFHAVALIASLAYLTLTKFFLDRIYAAFLLALYGVFLVIVILLGTGAVNLGV